MGLDLLTAGLCLGLALLIVLILPGSAAAHRPLFSGNRGTHPDTAVRIPDASVSHVVYSELTADAPYVWFVFDNDQPRHIPLQLAAPAGSGWEDTDPVVVLFNPEMSVPSDPRTALTPRGGSDGVTVIGRTHDARLFDEPFTGTKSWILADTEVLLSETGTYYGAVYDRRELGGKFWLAVGEREKFSWRDIWRLPGSIHDVRRFHDVPGWPSWMWVTGCVLVATPVAIGSIGRRLRQRWSRRSR